MLPFSLGEHPGMDGSFTVLQYSDPDEPEIAYVEHVAVALHLNKEAEVQACKLVFDRLRSFVDLVEVEARRVVASLYP